MSPSWWGMLPTGNSGAAPLPLRLSRRPRQDTRGVRRLGYRQPAVTLTAATPVHALDTSRASRHWARRRPVDVTPDPPRSGIDGQKPDSESQPIKIRWTRNGRPNTRPGGPAGQIPEFRRGRQLPSSLPNPKTQSSICTEESRIVKHNPSQPPQAQADSYHRSSPSASLTPPNFKPLARFAYFTLYPPYTSDDIPVVPR